MSRKEYLKYLAYIQKCEALIRKGELREAVRLLKSIPLKKVPRENRLAFANLARRTGQLHLGFRLLHGLINRNEVMGKSQARIMAEYANLLTQNGSVAEAQSLLQNVDLSFHHDLYLAMAWCHFERWEYLDSIPLLKKYNVAQKDGYFRLAGVINLAEAYVATGSYESGISLLTPAIEAAVQHGYIRLLANGLHLRAQAYLELGRRDNSDRDLAVALSIFGKKQASDAILIRRQAAFNEANKTGGPGPVLIFREEAQRAGAWESVRECDFQLLRQKFNRRLYDQLYFGTPYPAYRLRLKEYFKVDEPAYFKWGDRTGACLDLRNRNFRLGGREVKVTKQCLRILDSLVRDFYHPLSIGRLFSELFPHEYFDPSQSPVRVHQGLKRLRSWLAREGIPLEVRCSGKKYTLVALAPFCVLIPLELRRSEAPMSDGEKLSAHFRRRYFTAAEARRLFKTSKATMTRYLARAQDLGEVAKIGQGKSTQYQCLAG